MSKQNCTLTHEILLSRLDYNPLDGIFHWKVNPNTRVKHGDVAGCFDRGYIKIQINGKLYPAHRLAWLYVTGYWPKNDIDHKDGNKSNNRYENLRDVTDTENNQNQRKARKDSKSGHLGVSWNRQFSKWHAQIAANGKKIGLGYFFNIEDAINARFAGELLYHPTKPRQ